MDGLEWWEIPQKTHREALEILRAEARKRPWCGYFLGDPPLDPGNLNSKCRIGHVPFDDCVQDRFYLVDRSRQPEILASGGYVTQIAWDGRPDSLPAGWQGSVLRSYEDARAGRAPDTLVALLAFTPQRFRGRGLSSVVLSRMKERAAERGFRSFIVPALPPSQFERDKAGLSMEEIAALRREDGEEFDYWIRTHRKLGARVIGFCDSSHRFIYGLRDFQSSVSSTPIAASGEQLILLDKAAALGPNAKDMWRVAYADLERDFVTFDWGCVWIEYGLG